MIARQWVGETLESDADAYGKYLEETGIKEIKDTEGNQGVWLMRRVHEGRAEFIVISMWDSLDSIKVFAGHDYEKAVQSQKRRHPRSPRREDEGDALGWEGH
jgi:heme-degrading monooxygenase HmoA